MYGRFFELFFIAVFVYMLYRRLVRPFLLGIQGIRRAMTGQQPPQGQQAPPQPPPVANTPRASRIDRSKVEDAEYRDVD